jgi:hypothetical protein
MLTSWANHAALVAFGLSIGVLGRVLTLLMPASAEEALRRERRPEEGRLEAWQHRVDEQNVILAEARAASAPLRYVNWIVLLLTVVLIVMVAASPVRLEWWWLLGSILAGGLVAELASRLTRAGRLSVAWQEGARPFRLFRAPHEHYRSANDRPADANRLRDH